MRVPTSVRSALTTTPTNSSPRAIPAPDFACVKVLASPDQVLAALAPHVVGVPRDLQATIRGAPMPADGRGSRGPSDGGSDRRAVLYRIERDAWTTLLREGDRFAGCDVALARFLSTALSTRAFALFLDGAGQDLAYDVFEKGSVRTAALHSAGIDPEISGERDSAALEKDPVAHAREWLKRQDATNDRLAFRHFELTGTLRGRWDLSFERCVLLPELSDFEERSRLAKRDVVKSFEAARPPAEKPKTRKIEKPPAISQAMTREGERGVRSVLMDLIQQNTQGF